jgi:hypothetical protein
MDKLIHFCVISKWVIMEAMIHLRSFKENTQDEREPGPGQSSASAVSVGQWGESRFQ